MITRRRLLVNAGTAGLGVAWPKPAPAEPPLIDAYNPKVRETAASIAGGGSSDRARAVRLHDFVRDEIRFGWTRGFYDVAASQVLGRRRGYCVTKTTLMVALCRAAGIEARPVFVDIRADVIADLIDPGTPYVDHSYAEVFLEGRWVATDSYIVSAQHLNAARRRLQAEDRDLGWGAHIDGTVSWNGREDSFCQFVDNGRIADLRSRQTRRDPDVLAHFAAVDGWNETPSLIRAGFGVLAAEANRKADALAQGQSGSESVGIARDDPVAR